MKLFFKVNKCKMWILEFEERLGVKLDASQDGVLDSSEETLIIPNKGLTVKMTSGYIIGWKIITQNTNNVHLSVWEPTNDGYE